MITQLSFITSIKKSASHIARGGVAALLAVSVMQMSFFPLVTVYAEETGAGETIIATGDASSNADIVNVANTNTINTEPASTPDPTLTPKSSPSGESTFSPESQPAPVPSGSPDASPASEPSPSDSPDPSPSPSADPSPSPEPSVTPHATSETSSQSDDESDAVLIGSNANDATIGNSATSTALTGSNEATNNSGTTTIATGDADAGANVLNVANTNITEADVVVVSYNATSTDGSLDIRNHTSTTTPTETCPLECHDSVSLIAANMNTATTTNELAVGGDTGSNIASSSAASMIITGDASAAANVINILNSNFIGSQFMVVTINNTGDWNGDIVFPGKWFFERMAAMGTFAANIAVENTNTAMIINDVSVEADTGANTTQGDDSLIMTGAGSAQSNIVNLANTNLVGSSPHLYIMVNIGGVWGGTIFSLPEGADWRFESGGLVIGMDDAATSTPNGCCGFFSDATVTNTNTALVRNAVSVRAASGSNNTVGPHAVIRTGSAHAAANIFNLVNTNIIGVNGLIALINIAGDWKGNLAFGRPDLWLGASATTPHTPATLNTPITYTFTVRNRGDTDATGVRLFDTFSTQYLKVQEAGGGTADSVAGRVSWDIGAIPPGGSITRSYTASISDLPGGTTVPIINTSEVRARETDGDGTNNRDTITVMSYRPHDNGRGASWIPTGTWPPELVVTKTNNAASATTTPATVHYAITLFNKGMGPAYNTVVHDTVHAPTGKIMDRSKWDLGTVYAGDEIIIDYDLEFSSTTPSGIYTNTAYAQGRGGNERGYVVRSADAQSSVEIIGVSSSQGVTGGSGEGIGGGSGSSSEEITLSGGGIGQNTEINDGIHKTGGDSISHMTAATATSSTGSSFDSLIEAILPVGVAGASTEQNSKVFSYEGDGDRSGFIVPATPPAPPDQGRTRNLFAAVLNAPFLLRNAFTFLVTFFVLLFWQWTKARRTRKPTLPD